MSSIAINVSSAGTGSIIWRSAFSSAHNDAAPQTYKLATGQTMTTILTTALPAFPSSWGAQRCRTFSAWLHLNSSRFGAAKHSAFTRSLWTPPSDVPLARSPQSACVIIVPVDRHAYYSGQWREELRWLPQTVPHWSGGRNVVLIDLSGNEYDGIVHDAGFSDDLPPSQQCQRQGFGKFGG